MILSKPKTRAITSIALFILICFSIGFYNLKPILNDEAWWLNYLLFFLLVPLGVLLLIRQLVSYKTLTFKGNTVVISHPFTRSRKSLLLGDLNSWSETIIKTANGKYAQINMNFQSYSVGISDQEHTNYKPILTLLNKKYKKKKQS